MSTQAIMSSISAKIQSTGSLSAALGAGSIVAGDYQITLSSIEGGHRLTVRKGSEVQTMDIKDGLSDVPVASEAAVGVVKVGDNLEIGADGRLSVVTADAVVQDNTRPITSAAVYTEVGNINALLATI